MEADETGKMPVPIGEILIPDISTGEYEWLGNVAADMPGRKSTAEVDRDQQFSERAYIIELLAEARLEDVPTLKEALRVATFLQLAAEADIIDQRNARNPDNPHA